MKIAEIIKETALMPIDGRKSFYGKAVILHTADAVILKSYETNVCAIVNGEFIRMWNKYSATTMRHINAFRAKYKLPPISKAEWLKL